ncbi:MAG: lipoyl synthase [Candidatus Omnitrophota bacterium]
MKKPDWIRAKISLSDKFNRVKDLLKEKGLNTVCVEASCPNKGECWEKGHVTFMILGNICTRGCLFCDVASGVPSVPDNEEAQKITSAIKELKSRYIVITSVTRDDLEDKGANHFCYVVKEIKSLKNKTLIELLIPDFSAKQELLEKIAFSGADVIGHNIEMPEKLYPEIRPKADYNRSLDVLRTLSMLKQKKSVSILVKSSLMVGLGEKNDGIVATFKDLKSSGVDILYIGQYLSPSKSSWSVKKYYKPEEFEDLKRKAQKMGFRSVFSGPLVRSSYRAYRSYRETSV